MILDPWNVFSSSFGSVDKPCTAFVTLLDMAIYAGVMANVGRARLAYKIPVPTTEGPQAFQRILRVQANTVEQLVLHLPLLWIAAFAMDDIFAASLGAVWALARILYAHGYYKRPKRRAKGFIIGLAVNALLFVGAVAGTIASF